MEVHVLSLEEAKKLNTASCQKAFPKRFAHAMEFVQEEDRLRSLAAGALLHGLLGISEDALAYNENGKPCIKAASNCKSDVSPYSADIATPHFNLSHSGDYVVFCRGENELGIDIEAIDESNLFIAEKVYTPDELKWMNEDKLNCFHVLWTIKESVLKAIGSGISIDPISFSVMDIIKDGCGEVFGKTWYCKSTLLNGHVLSLCSEKPIDELLVIENKHIII